MIRFLWVLTGIAVVVTIIALLFGGLPVSSHRISRSAVQRFNDRVQYIEKKLKTELTTEEKFLLLDAYYYLGRHKNVVDLAVSMKHEIVGLPEERRQSVIEMVRESFESLGLKSEATDFVFDTQANREVQDQKAGVP